MRMFVNSAGHELALKCNGVLMAMPSFSEVSILTCITHSFDVPFLYVESRRCILRHERNGMFIAISVSTVDFGGFFLIVL
ncbi:uncharacterized protein EV422DRAFT_574165 [Fimicolochytrium jonesii]|uniref:uncharacterized protein n=1 Tax=Fimicolochytrium jonesii TaxID=1396493 RepID=UPI0022FE61A7|nr:uncharacterized protein EV422DRAFT_574165 [Fimicolochytrium jonesii]KAI8819429.1 hypothetical protein EV422DRAFT_574165 [Fimicolochytrium jonesii]